MRKCFLVTISLVFFINVYSQNDVNTFFNDTLKGKWILDHYAVLEASYTDYSRRDIDYVLFEEVTNQNYVKYSSYINGIYSSDSIKLYLPSTTYIGKRWTCDNFLFPNEEEIIIKYEEGSLSLLQNSFHGYINYYYKDSSVINNLDIHESYNLSVYPLITKDKIFISSQYNNDMIVKCYNLNGDIVQSNVCRGSNITEINISQLQAGFYILEIIINDKSETKKILKK